MAPWWQSSGTEVLFAAGAVRVNFQIEQFWGRAARASRARKSRDARYIWTHFSESSISSPKKGRCHRAPPFYFVPILLVQFVEIVKFTVM